MDAWRAHCRAGRGFGASVSSGVRSTPRRQRLCRDLNCACCGKGIWGPSAGGRSWIFSRRRSAQRMPGATCARGRTNQASSWAIAGSRSPPHRTSMASGSISTRRAYGCTKALSFPPTGAAASLPCSTGSRIGYAWSAAERSPSAASRRITGPRSPPSFVPATKPRDMPATCGGTERCWHGAPQVQGAWACVFSSLDLPTVGRFRLSATWQ